LSSSFATWFETGNNYSVRELIGGISTASTRIGNPSLILVGISIDISRKIQPQNSKLSWVCVKDKCGQCKGKMKTTWLVKRTTVSFQTQLEWRFQ
jgi:hypothetical protein